MLFRSESHPGRQLQTPMPGSNAGHRRRNRQAFVAQLVEQRTENPRVVGSIPTEGTIADLAHLVERHLAKVEVASSNLVIRSKRKLRARDYRAHCCEERKSTRRHSQAVRQRSAKPLSPVQFRVAPPKSTASSKREAVLFILQNSIDGSMATALLFSAEKKLNRANRTPKWI